MKNYIVYDLETFGKNIYYDRIAQFAGLRLDENFEIIPDSQLVLYCRLPLDYLPTRDSVLITGITPQEVQDKGLSEPEFAKKLYDYFSEKQNTAIFGYNNHKFDDKMLESLFFRNILPVYEFRSSGYRTSCDLYSLIKALYFAKENIKGITWPVVDNKLSFKLEEFANFNSLPQPKAHDAMGDVIATANLLKLVSKIAPEFLSSYINVCQNKEENIKRINRENNKKCFISTTSLNTWLKTNEQIQPGGVLFVFATNETQKEFLAFDLLCKSEAYNKCLPLIKDFCSNKITEDEFLITKEEINKTFSDYNENKTIDDMIFLPIKVIKGNQGEPYFDKSIFLKSDWRKNNFSKLLEERMAELNNYTKDNFNIMKTFYSSFKKADNRENKKTPPIEESISSVVFYDKGNEYRTISNKFKLVASSPNCADPFCLFNIDEIINTLSNNAKTLIKQYKARWFLNLLTDSEKQEWKNYITTRLYDNSKRTKYLTFENYYKEIEEAQSSPFFKEGESEKLIIKMKEWGEYIKNNIEKL